MIALIFFFKKQMPHGETENLKKQYFFPNDLQKILWFKNNKFFVTEEVMNAWENSIPKSLKDAASLA